MDYFIEYLGGIASLIGSLTVVGGALMWGYNQFISKPRERRREREEKTRQDWMVNEITRFTEPLNKTIKELSKILNESKQDRENLNRIATENSKKLKHHEEEINENKNRLIAVEVKTGLRNYRYKDEGGE